MRNDIQLSLEKAVRLIDTNKLNEARRILLDIERSSPNNIQVYHLLSVISGMSANYVQCEIYCKKALSINNKASIILNNMGSAQKLQGKYEEAKHSFQKSIAIQRDYLDAYVNLANLYIDIEKIDDADSIITTALKIDGNNMAVKQALGNLRLKQDQQAEAITIYKNILESQPNNTDIIINLGQLYEHLGDNNIALSYYYSALKFIPNYDQSIIGISSILEKQGKYKEALDTIIPAIENSRNLKLHIILGRIHSRLKNYTEAENILLSAKNLISIDQYKQELLYELGDVQDKLSHYSDAFTSYYYANKINKIEFDREQSTAEFLTIKTYYNANTFSNLPTSNNQSTQPVFIVGMPRSGTSLVEQILASHSQMHGGGELEYIDEIIQSLESRTKDVAYPHNMTKLNNDDIQESAEKYLSKLRKLSIDASYITNKMPHNFLHLGLIQQLFPNAKVVHCLRQEKDTALSIYFHQFNTNHPYANDLSDLHFYYQKYRGLMKHWHQESSLDIYTIKYEELIKNPENECKQLIQFFNLNWENNCLNFHNNDRLVNTPSYHQVKSPLYKNAVNRHLNYIKYLEDFS